jgi:hypothetical protein
MRWPDPPARAAGAAAMVAIVAGAVALIVIAVGAMFHQLRQQGRAGAVALVVIVPCVVLDVVAPDLFVW